MTAEQAPQVAVIMGSDSDYRVLSGAVDVLDELGVSCEVRVVSAHRTPRDMVEFASSARERGVAVIIAGAGGAAHLPGMVASLTTLPVIGVPVDATTLSGLDALLSIVQMPKGVPVATMAVDGARNAGLLAARILSLGDERLASALNQLATDMADAARAGNDRLPPR
jgi:5-(carboxyamino)imidazole ribonucleotide mutase